MTLNDKNKAHNINHFISGALSGMISRAMVAPLDRLKILYQVNYIGKGINPPGILKGFKDIYKYEGIKGLFRGNLVNLMKTTPDFAIKLYSFSILKYYFYNNDSKNYKTIRLLFCGGISGIIATIFVFPLDVIKTRLSATSSNTYNGLKDTTIKLYKEGGFRIFFTGIKPSLISTIPNSGLNLGTYDTLKKIFSGSSSSDNGKLLSGSTLMLIGALSAFFSSTIFYPFQTLQSRIIMGNKFIDENYNNNKNKINLDSDSENLKVNKMKIKMSINLNLNLINNDYNKFGLLRFVKFTFDREGIRGFYKGYIPGISKIMMGNALGYTFYEKIKVILDSI
jgi:solute carrier family 25 phosphate transporter 23/24/25/41